MHLDLPTWQRLDTPDAAALIEAAATATTPNAIEKLRKHHDAPLVTAAIELARARAAAQGRLPNPATLFTDTAGVAMASSFAAATHKATRFASINAPVADLCSGIGGDTLALTSAGITTEAFDLDPTRAWMTHRNTGAPTHAADITKSPLPDGPFHLDPARRAADGRRSIRLEDLTPGLDFLTSLLVSHPTGAIKLAPGTDAAAIPNGEVEVISERGTLTQAILWTGRLARAPRTATLLTNPRRDQPTTAAHTHTLTGTPTPATVLGRAKALGRFVFDVDPAPERADLLGEIARQTNLALWHPALGLFTGDDPIDNPWLTRFELIESMDWKEPRVRTALHAHGAGIVEVKTRGRAVEPDALQTRLRGPGTENLTLFVYRYDRRPIALMTRRCQ